MKAIHCCPFCGSHSVRICRTNPDACWISCTECGAEAEGHKTKSGAIRNWNRRHYDDYMCDRVQDENE